MKALAAAATLALLFAVPTTAAPISSSQTLQESGPVMHGGGCRASSPPGQCCHMETRTGTVHCH